ncbi:NAD(P)/FAD-dependent oxidoreductase [Alteromonadaceae bacterium M269]|nr:NAD(P)/FAD-dependent oxidoreductase [Alteromonadaceae bacterium M269]
MKPEYIDIIVIGAGLSGIGSAYYLQKNCPQKSLVIFEGREALGGTWDLFKYPGIRSDSDMFTYGYTFNPWTDSDSLASGEKLLSYLKDTTEKFKLNEKVRYQHRVKKLDWSSSAGLWSLVVDVADETKHYQCQFVLCCTGYYNYESGYQPAFKGLEEYKGRFVHPQHWPEDLNYQDKKVVVIGSGATAVTLIPNLAKHAEKVTMLQRSPTYIISRPQRDLIQKLLSLVLPQNWVSNIVRKKNVLLGNLFYHYMVKNPEKAKKFIAKQQNKVLGNHIDRKHFTPAYNPWDQRLCLVPDGDLFESLNSRKAEIKTDHIEHFTEKGIQLKSGEHLEADIVVSATGLNLEVLSGVELTVDGELVPLGDKMFYRGVMLEDTPNLGMVFGYTNASWTLKVELVAQYIARVINHMDQHHHPIAVPQDLEQVKRELFLNLNSGYITRVQDKIPKQGAVQPWRLDQNYNIDKKKLRDVSLEDGILQFKPLDSVNIKQPAAKRA